VSGIEPHERVTVELPSGQRLPMLVLWVKEDTAGVRFLGPIAPGHTVNTSSRTAARLDLPQQPFSRRARRSEPSPSRVSFAPFHRLAEVVPLSVLHALLIRDAPECPMTTPVAN
jgi:hypothetical protein